MKSHAPCVWSRLRPCTRSEAVRFWMLFPLACIGWVLLVPWMVWEDWRDRTTP